MSIIVGYSPIYRPDAMSSRTVILDGSQAQSTGLIRDISFYCDTALSNIKVASFTRVGQNMFTTRAYVQLDDASQGYNGYHAGGGDFEAFEIHEGDYIGMSFCGAPDGLRYGRSPEWLGHWYIVPYINTIPCINQEFTKYNTTKISLYASGAATGLLKINIGDSWKLSQGIKINIDNKWETVDTNACKINIGDSWEDVT